MDRPDTPRPAAVVFDVIETLFPLDPIAARLDAVGIGEGRLAEVFASILRDAFALGTAGDYRPFPDVARAVLGTAGAGSEEIDHVLAGFSELAPHDDVGPALDRLREAGVRLAALTNGTREVTETNLARAGLSDRLEAVMVIDDVGRWKPQAAVYHHAAATLDLAPSDCMLVAAHGWDCHGAMRAGLRAAYVARGGVPYPAAMAAPEITAPDLDGLADALLA